MRTTVADIGVIAKGGREGGRVRRGGWVGLKVLQRGWVGRLVMLGVHARRRPPPRSRMAERLTTASPSAEGGADIGPPASKLSATRGYGVAFTVRYAIRQRYLANPPLALI